MSDISAYRPPQLRNEWSDNKLTRPRHPANGRVNKRSNLLEKR
jgi:hypothetical protein